MNKIWAAVIAIVVILVAAGAFWLLYIPPVTAAILYIDEGSVEVDQGRGWITATDQMELKQGNKVRTGEGSASVVLLEGEILHLEPQSEVTLTEISPEKARISQTAGETWNKVTRISGIKTYEVETPTTVATVRGTEFYVLLGPEDEVAVQYKEVDVGFIRTRSKRIIVGPQLKVTLNPETDEIIEEENPNDPRAERFRQIYIKILKMLREREMQKHSTIFNIAKKAYGITDEQVQQYLDDLDAGNKDLKDAYSNLPKPLQKKAERAYKITQAIQSAQQ